MGRPGTSCAGTPSCWRSPPRPPISTPGVPAPEPSRVLLLPDDILVSDADLELSGFDSGQCSTEAPRSHVGPASARTTLPSWRTPSALPSSAERPSVQPVAGGAAPARTGT